MEVLFPDKNLEKLCTDEATMRRKRGDIAVKLRLRVKALQTADNLAHLAVHDPLGHWHELTGDLACLWAGSLSRNYRIMVRPEGPEPAAAAVTVTVVDITDYH
jgi:toxin HigB-1